MDLATVTMLVGLAVAFMAAMSAATTDPRAGQGARHRRPGLASFRTDAPPAGRRLQVAPAAEVSFRELVDA